MAQVNGTVSTIYSGSDLLLHSKSATLNTDQNLYDTSNKGSAGWATHGNGQRTWTIDFDGMYDEAGSGLTADEIVALIVGRTADTTVKFGTSASAATGWEGTGTFQNITIDSPLEESMTFSGQIVGNGALAAI